MANIDFNLRSPQTQHILTIQQARRDLPLGTKLPSRHPWLRLSGKWLVFDAGFMPQQRVKVQVEFEKIIITPFD